MNLNQRIQLAKQALKGISIGDAFGESFFGESSAVLKHIFNKDIPETSWEFTDDTVMAIAVFEQLEKFQNIDQDHLVAQFVNNHNKDVNRGYGATVRRVLREIGEGGDWKSISFGVFEGMGSMGNGAAMRVSPIGAFYSDNIEKVKDLAAKSAEVTHSNLEGITGALAVAIAASLATQVGQGLLKVSPNDFIVKIVNELPESDTTSKIRKSLSVPYSYSIETVKTILGNGSKITAQEYLFPYGVRLTI